MTTLAALAESYQRSKQARPCPLCGDTTRPKVYAVILLREVAAANGGAGKTITQKSRTVCEQCAVTVFTTSVEALGYGAAGQKEGTE